MNAPPNSSLTPLQKESCSNLRRSARLISVVPSLVVQPTIVSHTSTLTSVGTGSSSLATTQADAVSSHPELPSYKQVSGSTTSIHNTTTTRRSKRLTTARSEYKKKLKTSLFLQTTTTCCDDLPFCHEDLVGHSMILKDYDHGASMSFFSTKTKETPLDTLDTHVHVLYRSMASRYYPNLLTSCPVAHNLSYLFKATYGTQFSAHLFDWEEARISRRNESAVSPSVLRVDGGRPRTRSICREEEKELFRVFCPSTAPFYITSKFQSHITSEMRCILVDWMMNVAMQLHTTHETIHCAVKLLDIGLEKIVMTTETFHSYGCACLLIACKLNEVKRTKAVDIAFFTDGSCTTQEICAMELKICMELGFQLQTVTSFHFMDHFLDMLLLCSIFRDNEKTADAIMRYNPKLHAMALFIIETALVLPALVDVKDSLIAAASLYLARALIGGVHDTAIWNDDLVHLTGYNVEQLTETITLLHRCHKTMSQNRHLKSVVKKYNSATYHYVAQKTSIVSSDLKLF